jgi:hypothetical protein
MFRASCTCITSSFSGGDDRRRRVDSARPTSTAVRRARVNGTDATRVSRAFPWILVSRIASGCRKLSRTFVARSDLQEKNSRTRSGPSAAGTSFVPARGRQVDDRGRFPAASCASITARGVAAAFPAGRSVATGRARPLLYSWSPRLTGVVSVDPFFAKIMASSWAGSVWLALADSSCTEPGGSKNISPTL